MSARKMYSIAVPSNKEDDFDDLKTIMKRVTDLSRIHNKKALAKNPEAKLFPENVAELILYGMEGVCGKLVERLEGKISEEEIEKMEKSREYLREYYREYRGNKSKKKA